MIGVVRSATIITVLFAGIVIIGPTAKSETKERAATKHKVKDARKRLALCNDGSPAAYYFRPGAESHRRKWILYLDSNGECIPEYICGNGVPSRTSNGLPDRIKTGGLTSTSSYLNPDFASFNHVIVHYCSMDEYAGNSARKFQYRDSHFRGHQIIDGVIEDLMNPSVIGANTLRDATELLFAGSAAGGFGVQNNLDRVAAKLPWAHVKGVIDGSWVPDIPPFDSSGNRTALHSQLLAAGVPLIPDESCATANSGSPERCLETRVAFPFITTPVFIVADLRDSIYLDRLGIDGDIIGSQETNYILRYGDALQRALRGVPAVFGPAAGTHTMLYDDRFQSVKINGRSLGEILGNWYFNRDGPTQMIADPLTGARISRSPQ